MGTKAPKTKRARKRTESPALGKRSDVAPGMVRGGVGTPEPRVPPGMLPEELEYRTLLQEALLWVSKQVLEEQREDILTRAEARVRTLQELRG